jgi:hypothetical protein
LVLLLLLAIMPSFGSDSDDNGSYVSDAEEVDEVGETLDVDQALLEDAFSRGLSKNGKLYLEKLEMMVVNDSELENEVDDVVESMSILKEFVGDGGEHANKLSLQDLENFGITSEKVRQRIGLLAFLMGNRSPSNREINSLRRESSLSGVQSQASGSGEYEDDFEALDDTDESPRVRLRKHQHQHHQQQQQQATADRGGGRGYTGGDEDGDNGTRSFLMEKGGAGASSSSSSGSDCEVDDVGGDDDDEDYGEGRDYTVEYEDEEDVDDMLALSDRGVGDSHYPPDGGGGGEEEEIELVFDSRLKNRAPSAPQYRKPPPGASHQSVDQLYAPRKERKEGAAAAAAAAVVSASVEGGQRAVSAGAVGKRRKTKMASWIANHKWTLGEKIGSGSFGEVYQGMNDHGRLFAVKQLHIAGQMKVVDELANEIQLMRDYAHPNVVGYLGAEVDEKKGVVNIFQEWVRILLCVLPACLASFRPSFLPSYPPFLIVMSLCLSLIHLLLPALIF